MMSRCSRPRLSSGSARGAGLAPDRGHERCYQGGHHHNLQQSTTYHGNPSDSTRAIHVDLYCCAGRLEVYFPEVRSRWRAADSM